MESCVIINKNSFEICLILWESVWILNIWEESNLRIYFIMCKIIYKYKIIFKEDRNIKYRKVMIYK